MKAWISTLNSIFVGVVVTVVGGYLLTVGSNEKETVPKKPELSLLSQQIRVPAQPIPYDVRSRAIEEAKDPDLERALSNASSGFIITQFNVVNESDVVLRDVEVTIRGADQIYQSAPSKSTKIDKPTMTFNIPPGEMVRLIAMHGYSEATAFATYGESYFKSEDIADHAEKKGASVATRYIEDRYWLLDETIVTGLAFIFLPLFAFVAMILVFSRRSPTGQATTSAIDGTQEENKANP
ncbi:hypothetical protein RMR21_015535 [Agrobacterium sp. rho-8.1]|nr:hypothetical protein [Agrobacterium sp. rho-8.1]